METRLVAAVLLFLAPAFAGCMDPVAPLDAASLAPALPPLGPSTYDAVGDGKVLVHRDGFGVPHLYADDENALAWGLGFVMAEDRLFQMEILRRAGSGRLAELVGPSALAADERVRLVRGGEEARWRAFDTLGATDQATFRAFVDGINAGAAAAFADPARTPVEFIALGAPPKPWTVTDVVAIANLLVGEYGEFGGKEGDNAALYAHLTAELGDDAGRRAFDDLVPFDPTGPTTIAPRDLAYPATPLPNRVPDAQLALLEPGVLAALAGEAKGAAAVAATFQALGVPTSLGSNAAVVSGAFTTTGRPLLWGGPQVGHAVPNLFYEFAWHGAGHDGTGFTVPGVLAIAIGRTATSAWTVTSGMTDNVDLFVEEVHPDDPARYRVPGGWARFEERIETFLVRPDADDAAPTVVTATQRATRHGPVVGESPDGRFVVARQSALGPDYVKNAVCWGRFLSFSGFAAVQACASEMTANFNWFYAHADGTIAYTHVGQFSDRASGFDPRLPLPGDGSAERAGFYPDAWEPRVTNPTKGWIANWNNQPAAGWPQGDHRGWWGEANRGASLERLFAAALADGGKLDFDGLQRLHEAAATTDAVAPAFRDVVAQAPASAGRDAIVAWLDAGAPILDADGDGRVDDLGVGAWRAFFTAVAARVLDDELGPFTWTPDFRDASSSNADSHGQGFADEHTLLRALADRSLYAFADDVATPQTETGADAVAQALTAADAAVAARVAMPVHTFQQIGAAEVDAVPRMNRGSINQFVSLEHPVQYASVAPPGQSGLVTAAMFAGAATNPHLTDQRDLYAGFAAKAVPFTVADVEAGAVTTRLLDVVPGVTPPTRLPATLRDAHATTGLPDVGVFGLIGT